MMREFGSSEEVREITIATSPGDERGGEDSWE
jgi:hypothetical protein